MKQQQPTLDERISMALGNGKIAADDLQMLIPELEAGIEEADGYAKQQRERSLDPAIDVAEAPQFVAVAELRRDRLKAALPRLQAKLAQVLQAEYADRWRADANKVAAMINAAAKQVARYREWADQIAAVLREAEIVNRELERVNHAAPDGVHERLCKLDLSHLKNLVLPDPEHPNCNVWPPPQPSVAEMYAATMVAPAHPGADWASEVWQQRRVEAMRTEQQRQSEYYANLTKQQEERRNREEKEFAQSRR